MPASDLSFDTVTESVTATVTAPMTPGVFDLCVRGTDSQGNVGIPESILFVVYDPNGGFVTGGGWIDSPAGAYVADAGLVGPRTSDSYQSTRKAYRFRWDRPSFSSTSYQWLVISGARAQYKGSGTINGTGDYGFLLTAIDGQISGGGGTDKFRIKIWDKVSGDIVYDNQIGAPDSATLTSVISGGSIVIHKK